MNLLCYRCGEHFEPINEAFPECPTCGRRGPFQICQNGVSVEVVE